MTTSSDDTVQTLQHDVQRLLGRCLLRLQQYERLVKAIITHYDISGPAHALETVRAARVASTAGKTLGWLVRELLGSYVVADTNAKFAEPTINVPEDVPSVSFRVTLRLPDADFARTESEIEELVLLRNNLVHHFLDQHDLCSPHGCRDAQEVLQAAYSRIDQHLNTLREWAEDMEQAQRTMAEFVQSDEFRGLVTNGLAADDSIAADDGIAPDSTVDWPTAAIERVLREAAGALAVNGWAPVGLAAKWIAERYPEQIPLNYGCRSWWQFLRESRSFEFRYFKLDGQRSAWYRGIEFHDRKPA